MSSIDTSDFVTAEEYDAALRSLVRPEKPDLDAIGKVKRSGFADQAAYEQARGAVARSRDNALGEYEKSVEAYLEARTDIQTSFVSFAFKALGLSHLPVEVKSEIFSRSYGGANFDGLADVYYRMKEVSGSIVESYEAGREQESERSLAAPAP